MSQPLNAIYSEALIYFEGCPEPREDHATNCVKMGLSMIRAIKEFDKECNEDVNMRVGIHTGTVLCGIVGRKRFKFDVWSNDVTLANRMESTGKPGKVHISEKTYQFLKEDYFVEEADDFLGKYRTFNNVLSERVKFPKVASLLKLAKKTNLQQDLATPRPFLI